LRSVEVVTQQSRRTDAKASRWRGRQSTEGPGEPEVSGNITGDRPAKTKAYDVMQSGFGCIKVLLETSRVVQLPWA